MRDAATTTVATSPEPAQKRTTQRETAVTDSAFSLLDAVPVPLVLLGPNERVAHANPPAVALFSRDLPGRHYVTAFRAPVILSCIEAVMTGPADRAEDRLLVSESSREATWKITASAVIDGGRRSVLVAFEDTTAL